MEQGYNKRTYAIIPTNKAHLYIKSNFENGRFSSDESLIVWDQNWDKATFEALRNDHDVKLFNHKAILGIMNTPAWKLEYE